MTANRILVVPPLHITSWWHVVSAGTCTRTLLHGNLCVNYRAVHSNEGPGRVSIPRLARVKLACYPLGHRIVVYPLVCVRSVFARRHQAVSVHAVVLQQQQLEFGLFTLGL